MPLTPWSCGNCGFWQRWFAPPPSCPVCVDVRNDLPEDGFTFLSPDDVARRVTCSWSEVVPGVWGFGTAPRYGLDSKGWLCLRPEGNVAVEAAAWYAPDALDAIEALGGIAVLVASHPHAYGALWQLQDRFEPEVVVGAGDLEWTKAFRVTWPADENLELRPGLTLHHSGGHFAGHSLVHHEPAGALFSGDTLKYDTDPDGAVLAVSSHYAFHTSTPVSQATTRRYRELLAGLEFDHVFTPFGHASGDIVKPAALALFDRQLADRPSVAPLLLEQM